jgi:hypothetical protein
VSIGTFHIAISGCPRSRFGSIKRPTKQLRAEGRRSVDERVLFEIVEQQRDLAEGARKSTRARRAAERRRPSSGSLGDSFASEQNPPTPGALQREPVQAFEVEEWD